MTPSYLISLATLSDIEKLTNLVNLAYRPQHSTSNAWTHESEWVSGDRINPEQMQTLLSQPNTIILKATQDNTIFGCVHISQHEYFAEIGMLSVHPSLQNSGLGKKILIFAENYIEENWSDCSYIQLSVMTVRESLLSFYLRRGYVQTGIFFDYPLEANVGQPKTDLKFEYLRKNL